MAEISNKYQDIDHQAVEQFVEILASHQFDSVCGFGAGRMGYPSLYEGFGIPILEAARCGCIPIVGPTPALMEIGHNTALITNSFDAQDWGSLIYRYSTNPTQRSETQERIRTGSSDFSWAKSARDTIDVIKS